jgi:hypothetical protein
LYEGAGAVVNRYAALRAQVASAARSSSATSILPILSIASIARRARGVRIVDQLAQSARHDLPRQPEPVLEPATRARFAAVGRQRFPQPIDLRLVPAVDDQRQRLVEPELRAPVEALQLLAGDGEVHRQHHAGHHEGISVFVVRR